MPTENFFVIVMSLPIWTGMTTSPCAVSDVLAVMVMVGAVASVSLDSVMPVGTVHSESVTVAATCSAPRIAMTCVVVLPALAAEVVPGKTYASLVRMTLYASVRSTSVT